MWSDNLGKGRIIRILYTTTLSYKIIYFVTDEYLSIFQNNLRYVVVKIVCSNED
jgi:hypothetical protein